MTEREKLVATIQRLRAQLAESGLDPSLYSSLSATIDEAEASLSAKDPAAPPATLARRLADATGEFEASHPVLAGTVGSLIEALARMGI